MLRPKPDTVDFLILGAGWTSTFLIPLLQSENVAYAATTTTGRDGSIEFKFDPDSSDTTPYKRLPKAQTVLITFPLKGHGQSKHLTSLYADTHEESANVHFIQLGATSIWKEKGWADRNSPYDKSNARAIAEDELLASPIHGAVLDLAGLWGGERQPRKWLTRVFKSKADVSEKQAFHMVHGADVARGILAVHRNWDAAGGRRWLVSDLRTYDWWDLVLAWTSENETYADYPDHDQRLEIRQWVWECMEEQNVRALPRDREKLGRVLDARDFWREMGILPAASRLG